MSGSRNTLTIGEEICLVNHSKVYQTLMYLMNLVHVKIQEVRCKPVQVELTLEGTLQVVLVVLVQ